MVKYILASASPRRTELLSKIKKDFEVITSSAEEDIKESRKFTSPAEKVCALSLAKASDVAERVALKNKGRGDGFIIIGADTVVAAKGEILEKPAEKEEAREMIRLLQGEKHEVFTGVTVIYLSPEDEENKQKTFYETTTVEIYPMDEEEIEEYISTGEPYDKAGGYAVQGRFSAFIKGICGDYSNVVGLPAGRLYHEIKELLKGRTNVR